MTAPRRRFSGGGPAGTASDEAAQAGLIVCGCIAAGLLLGAVLLVQQFWS